MSTLKSLLFKIARSPFAGYFIGFSFAHLTRLMPLDRLWETKRMILFKHPVPSSPVHWLAVPKRRIPSFMSLDFADAETQQIVMELVEGLVQTAVSQNLPTSTIVVNGGTYQDVPQLHFHLISNTQSEPTTTVFHNHFDMSNSQLRFAFLAHLAQTQRQIAQRQLSSYRLQATLPCNSKNQFTFHLTD